ncbi:MAG: serine/threonine-protein kinase [Pirellulales bacterium]
MTKSRDILGPYRLTRLIRMGSTCQVFEAVDMTDQKRYALKVLRPDHRNNKAEIASLRHEFEVAKNLSHKNLIRIFKFETDTELPYLVLELFSELNMKQALRRGPDSLAFMLDKILEQCVESLYYLHSKGFVHCDVKPDNFLVSRDGEVRLIDFTISQKIAKGIAKLFRFGSSQVQGTRSYMSPEQIRGEGLDPRSDIYSLGCVLYELVTGKPPFTGESPNDLLNKHISAPIPSPLVINDNVTADYAALVRKMMSKRADQRPESMWDVLKLVRGTKIFKKPPRVPDRSIFDDFPTAGRIDSPEQAEGRSPRSEEKKEGPEEK